MVANSLDWGEIAELVKEAQQAGDRDALVIAGLKLQRNQITIKLQFVRQMWGGGRDSRRDGMRRSQHCDPVSSIVWPGREPLEETSSNDEDDDEEDEEEEEKSRRGKGTAVRGSQSRPQNKGQRKR
jgi:hypothetical protein